MKISNFNIPDNKSVLFSLTYIKGIGLSTSHKILKILNIDNTIKTLKLTPVQISKIENHMKDFLLGQNLTNEVRFNIKKLINLKTYRGIRHIHLLPVRGQHTKRNAKTRKNQRQKISSKKTNFKFKNKK